MKIAIFGAGWIGKRLQVDLPGVDRRLQEESIDRINITDGRAVRRALRLGKFNVAINAAGKTGRPNVDWCESNRQATYESNVSGALVLASACREAGAHLVHLGSGCIFYGPSPHATSAGDPGWQEIDPANPASYYSKTKYAADLALGGLPGVCILRLRMPVGGSPHPRNLLTKLAGYPRVIDVSNSVTVVKDLVEVVRQAAERRLEGIFHATNPGALAHREILQLYRERIDLAHRAEFIAEGDLVASGLAVAPRSSAILATERLSAVGIHMRPVQEAVSDAIEQYGRALGSVRVSKRES